jgi:hypothetical protein
MPKKLNLKMPKDMTPEQRMHHQGLVRQRPDGWVVMDGLGLSFLHPDLKVRAAPYYYSSRGQAREMFYQFHGKPQKGRKRDPTRWQQPPARVKFERLFGCLMHLWKVFPGSVTLDSVQEHVQKKIGRKFNQRVFRRDMESLTHYGYCTKAGPTFTAVPEYRRWWSDEFEDRPTPKTGEQS